MAYFGKSSQPLFSGDRNVCAKQSFYTKTRTVTRRDGRSVAVRQDIPYDGIPQMRFVKAGLAIEQVNEGERHCFLLEEVIPESEGSFRKYLNNTSAVPCHFTGEDDNYRAEFLAFAQHVQYFKTKKRAYVADFQG